MAVVGAFPTSASVAVLRGGDRLRLCDEHVFERAGRLTTKTKQKSRLSGWVRLWIVLTVLSWLAGAFDVAFSPQPFQWPLTLSDTSPQSMRQLLWFLGPILVASAWCAIRWVWRGFRPPPNQAVAPHMGTTELVRGAFSLLEKIGMTAFILAWIGGSIYAIIYYESPPFWLEMLMLIVLAWKFTLLINVWESEGPFDGKG